MGRGSTDLGVACPKVTDSLFLACRWRSYFTSGSSALYLFLYSAFYFYTKLDITKVATHTEKCLNSDFEIFRSPIVTYNDLY